MRSRVELFEQIRRDRDWEGLSIHELARRHGVHRRTVREALASPLPRPRKRPEGRPAPKLGEHRALIDSWLEADREAPRKQRHTARRVWERLRDEHGVEVSERQVRRYVRDRRRALGDVVDEVFVPLCHEPGAEAEVDWGEATVVIGGVPTKVFVFLMRACFSGGCFVQAHTRETQQAFLEAHVEAFEFFGGVFSLVRYDNLRSAVAKVLKGRRRVESDRFVALRSHYLFESAFTRPGKEGAHEKGGVEGEVGRFRRSHLVPVPEVSSLGELNDLLLRACVRRSGAHDPRSPGDGLAGARRDAELAAAAGRALRRGGAREPQGRLQGARHSPPEPVLGARLARRAARRRQDRGARGRVSPRRPRGRPPPAPGWALRGLGQARPLPGAAPAQAGGAGPLAGACPGARAGRLARLLRRALARDRGAARAERGRPPAGRRADALPGCRARPSGAGGPRGTRRRRARRARRADPGPARRTNRAGPAHRSRTKARPDRASRAGPLGLRPAARRRRPA